MPGPSPFIKRLKMSVKCVCLVLVCLSLPPSCSQKNRLNGFVYYRLNTNPTTLDPAYIVDVTGGSIAAKLFNGLVRLDDNFNVISDIAEDWSISKDGKTYLFRIRHKITTSQNQGIMAQDFKYSFKRILSPSTRSPNLWVLDKIAGASDFIAGKTDDIAGLQVIDDYTLKITLDKAFSPFLYLLTMPAAYVVREEDVNRHGADFGSHVVGTGPYVLKKWSAGRALLLTKRDDYFEAKPRVRGIVYRVIPEDLTTMTEFEIGNLDVVAVPGPEFRKYKESSEWRGLISSIEGINTYYIGMNCSRPPFDDVKLRRAMNLAIDRTKLLETFFERRGRLASGPVPDTLRKWETPPAYEYDPAVAKEIVRKGGWSGRGVKLYITSDPEVVDMAEFIQSYIRKTGLDVRIVQLEWSAYKEAINKGEADLFWLGWWADYPDPENFLFPLFHSSNAGPAGNRSRYRNIEVDRLIELGQGAKNERERNKYYGAAEKLIVAEAPWVFFWHRNDYTVRQKWIKDYKTYPIYSMDKGTDISF